MCFAAAGLSDAGVRRAVNEDAVAWRVSQAGDQALLVVADGMGAMPVAAWRASLRLQRYWK